jgi:hypothetical protein
MTAAHETESAKYARAMIAGADKTCAAIERVHGLYGYPPELVSVGLKAFDEGRDAEQAVEDYINADDGKEPQA